MFFLLVRRIVRLVARGRKPSIFWSNNKTNFYLQRKNCCWVFKLRMPNHHQNSLIIELNKKVLYPFHHIMVVNSATILLIYKKISLLLREVLETMFGHFASSGFLPILFSIAPNDANKNE